MHPVRPRSTLGVQRGAKRAGIGEKARSLEDLLKRRLIAFEGDFWYDIMLALLHAKRSIGLLDGQNRKTYRAERVLLGSGMERLGQRGRLSVDEQTGSLATDRYGTPGWNLTRTINLLYLSLPTFR